MSKPGSRAPVFELPEDLRKTIRADVESGLARFRGRNFEEKLRSAMHGQALDTHRPDRNSGFRLLLASAAALLAVVAGGTLLFLRRGPARGPDPLAVFLERMPGIQSLNRAVLDRALVFSPVSPMESPFTAPLAVAASRAEANPAIPTLAVPALIPRYTLEQKLEILTKENPIGRALSLIQSKSGEV